ncbi:hypothetical protein [Pseudomonas aeruginosa]|uniref:hypothetical protein n=1 Tax=Pseudomonas aeruginosa TaxID=287 RepID=UPI0039847B6E
MAYIEARIAGRECLTLSDISRAYCSSAYAANKEDVEELQLQALQNRRTGPRSDLRCPFELPIALKSNVVVFARADRDSRVIKTVFDSSLNENERAGLKHIEEPTSESIQPTKAPRPSRLPEPSDEDLANAFYEDLESMDPPSKPKKPR